MAIKTKGLKKARKRYDAQGKLIRARPVIKKPSIKKTAPPLKKKKKPGTPQYSAPGGGGVETQPTTPKKKKPGPQAMKKPPKSKPGKPVNARPKPVGPKPTPPKKPNPKVKPKKGGFGGYVAKYPDLAKAFKKHKAKGGKGTAASWGKSHYERHGKKEKRKLS